MSSRPDSTIAGEGLAAKVTSLLDSRIWHLNFGPDLERKFAMDVFPQRAKQFLLYGTVGPVLFALFYFDDLKITPDLPLLSACVRGIMPLFSLIFLYAVVRTRKSLLAQEVGISIIAGLGSLCQLALFYYTKSPDKVTVINGVFLYVLYGAVCIPLRFRVSLPAATLATAIICGTIANSSLDDVSKFDQIASLIALLVITLLVSYRMDYQSRQEYLLRTRENLRREELVKINKTLKDLSECDGLTGLLNRRALNDRLESAHASSIANAAPLGIIMVDVDHFKDYNDQYGHLAGDECLQAVARILSENIRRERDIIGRYGGEEFLIILPEADFAECLVVAERIRRALVRERMPHEGLQQGFQRYLTISQGVAVQLPGDPAPVHQLIHEADRELYNAKRNGRNRVYPLNGGRDAQVVDFDSG